MSMRQTSIAVSLLVFVVACDPATTEDVRVAATATTTTSTTTTTTIAETTVAAAPSTTEAATSSSTTTTTSPTTTAPPSTTTAPTTTTTTASIEGLPGGLFCRDLEPMGYRYDEAVEYWLREGAPDRMDADRNGIPCETVYPSDDVVAFWGDPLPTTTIAAGRYVVTEPTYWAWAGGSGPYLGSGCSPGTDLLPDGIWFGQMVDLRTTSIQFDLMCLEDVEAPWMAEAISNQSDRLRTVTVDGNAIAWHASGPRWEPVPYRSWHPDAPTVCGGDDCTHAWLYVNGGRVTELVQLRFP